MTVAAGFRRVIVPLILLTMVGVSLAPLSTGTPSADGSGDSEFRAFMEPRLAVLLASVQDVEDMVQERSRNILALRAESQRIETIITEIEAYLEEGDIPAWGALVIEHFRAGSAQVLEAIDAANGALRTFDFSSIPSMVPVFSEGRFEIDTALRTLRDHSVGGSSYTDRGVI